jgi:hypothetical protein
MLSFRSMCTPRARAAARAILTLCVALACVMAGQSRAALASSAVDITVTDVQLSTPAVSVSGLGGVQVTISATLAGASLGDSMSFEVSPTSGAGHAFVVVAGAVGPAVSGGRWSATFWVTSTDAGAWTLTGVGDADPYSSRPFSPVTGAPVLSVTGSHLPRLTVSVVPDPVPVQASGFTVHGTVVDTATGLPVAGARVGFGLDTGCLDDIADLPTYTHLARTSTAGAYSFPAPASAIEELISCVSLEGSSPFVNSDGVEKRILEATPTVLVQSWLTVTLASSTEPVGRPDAVAGSVGGMVQSPVCMVQLWQLHGSTQWRVVGQAAVRGSGRYTLAAVPTVPGRNYFKVYKPSCGAGGRYVAVSTSERVVVGT